MSQMSQPMSQKYQVRESRKKVKECTEKPKHCPICEKAGMSPEIVASHYVRETRDSSSRVTCPIILSNTCSKCGKKGHFATTCRVIAPTPKQPVVKKETISTSNRFCFSDSDTESETEPEPEPEPEPEQKTARDISRENLVIQWQKQFANMSGLNLDSNPYGVYWNTKYNKFVLKGYVIFEKTVNGEKLLLARPERTSWADSDSDSD